MQIKGCYFLVGDILALSGAFILSLFPSLSLLAIHNFHFHRMLSKSRTLCRPGQSQGLLYKHLRRSLTHPLVPTASRRRPAQTIRARSSNHKIDYDIGIKNFLNPKGHQHPISGSKVTAILLKGWILPMCGASAGRVCTCSLRSRLVFLQREINVHWFKGLADNDFKLPFI